MQLVSSVQALPGWLLAKAQQREVGGTSLLPALLSAGHAWAPAGAAAGWMMGDLSGSLRTSPAMCLSVPTAAAWAGGLAQAPCGGASPAGAPLQCPRLTLGTLLCTALDQPGSDTTALFSVPCTSVTSSRIPNGLAGCERCFHPNSSLL